MGLAYTVPELSVDVYLAANKDSNGDDVKALRGAFNYVKAREKYQKGFAGH